MRPLWSSAKRMVSSFLAMDHWEPDKSQSEALFLFLFVHCIFSSNKCFCIFIKDSRYAKTVGESATDRYW